MPSKSLAISSFREIRKEFKAFGWYSDNSTKDREKTEIYSSDTCPTPQSTQNIILHKTPTFYSIRLKW
jgi:hypothetical protein